MNTIARLNAPRGAMPMLFALLLAGLAPAPADSRAPVAMTLRVDLRDAPKVIFHATLRIPVTPGRLSLNYPKWVPGTHWPSPKIRAALPPQAAATWAAVQPASRSTFSSARALRSTPGTPGQSVPNTILSASRRSDRP